MTDLHPNAKSDTSLLLDAGLADIFVDHGPEHTSLTDQTTYLEESPSPRAAIDAPRNITIKLTMQSSWSGVAIELGRGKGNYSWRISLSGGVLSFAEEGLLRAAVTVPGLSGVSSVVLVNWSQRVEGTSVVDDIAVGNLTTAAWAFGTSTHAGLAPAPTDDLLVGQDNGATAVYTGGIEAFVAVHIGRRFRTATEAWEDWGGTPSSPAAFDGRDRTPAIAARANDLRIATEGSFAGPAFIMAGAATRQAGERGVGSLVNLNLRSPATERVTANPVRFYRAAPDGGGWQWSVRYLWHGFVGPKVNVAQVRIHVRAFDAGGGATISPVRFRSYSVSGLPLVGQPGDLAYHRGPIMSVTTTSTAGVWGDLGAVRLARDAAGLSYFCLGFKIDAAAGEGVTFNTAWKLNAITVDPFARELAAGGLGGDLDKDDP